MGDFAKKGDDGQLYFVDRGADIIKYKGYRVSASEIEAVLQDHPAIIAACAVGVPDAKTGERIKAIVVLKEDARGVSSLDLLNWCRERLAPYKVPRYIEFRDMLPKSKVGKLLRREIRMKNEGRPGRRQRSNKLNPKHPIAGLPAGRLQINSTIRFSKRLYNAINKVTSPPP